MSHNLAGKVAVVTGASKGIGASIATHLAAAGAAVVVNYASSQAAAEKVVDEITRQRGQAVAVQANVAKSADVERLFAETKRAFGGVDILVNNAGIYRFAALEAITAEHFHEMFDLNVLGLIMATQKAVKHFGPEGGSIVNISSVGAEMALPSQSVYSATKAAVNTLTRAFARELGPRKIRVNAISPGLVETEGSHSAGLFDDDFRQRTAARTPLRRIGQPDDIGPAVVFLASAEAGWITGETLTISCGLR